MTPFSAFAILEAAKRTRSKIYSCIKGYDCALTELKKCISNWNTNCAIS